jgi:AcrR family transcriptional regulator
MASKHDHGQADDLRHRRSQVSKDAIREAALALLAEGHPAALSIPAVADRAGVSVRTVYRHFPTKQDLLDDVASIQVSRVDKLMEGRGGLLENPGEYLLLLWNDFEQDRDAVIAQHSSQVGRDLRSHRMGPYRQAVLKILAANFPGTSEPDREDLTDLIFMMMSSAAFLDLNVRLGRSASEAARIVWWAVRVLAQRFEDDGGIDRNLPDWHPMAAIDTEGTR